MMIILGTTLVLILAVAATHSALRSAWCGITLSNGVDVLVPRDLYHEIVHRFETMDGHDAWKRWDRAILDVLRNERPHEWKFLMRSLGYHVPGDAHSVKRVRQAVYH